MLTGWDMGVPVSAITQAGAAPALEYVVMERPSAGWLFNSSGLALRIPTKLGSKNPKFVMASSVTNCYPRGFWKDCGYNWFSGS
jgi:hypothetical protein